MPDYILSTALRADIANWKKNLQEAVTIANSAAASTDAAFNNIASGVARVNSLRPGAAVARGLTEATQATRALDSETAKLTTNISRNIAAYDPTKVTAYVASLRQATTTTQQLTVASSALSTSISRNVAAYNPAAAIAYAASLRQVQQASTTANAAVTRGSNTAAFALTNLGRVAQDAPFGFIGIQNNLNPLLESFQRLRVESGSNAAALRLLGQSLIGPAGIGIALSLVTSAISFYTLYQQRANKATKESKSNTDEYINSLEDLEKANLKGGQNAQKDIVELTTLYGITQNTTLSVKNRTDAVNELQRQYPEYFKNLKDEIILNGGAKTAYDNLRTSIIATSKARAAQDILVKNSQRQLENEQKLIPLREQYVKATDELAKREERLAKLRSGPEAGTPGFSGIMDDAETRRADALSKVRDLAIQIRQLKVDTNILDERNLDLTKNITDQVVKGADLAGKAGDLAKTKEVKTLADVMKDLAIDIKQVDAEFQLTFAEKSEKKIDAYQTAISDLIKIGYDPATEAVKRLKQAQQDLFQLRELPLAPSANTGSNNAPKNYLGNDKGIIFDKTTRTNPLTRLTEEQKEMLRTQEQFNDDFGKLVQSGLADNISGIASAIGTAIAEGGNIFQAVGSALLGGFADFLSQFGKLLIEYGAAALLKGKLDAALLIPGAGIIAGPAAIAAGIALQIAAAAFGGLLKGKSGGGNTGGGVTAFANGGVVYGPTNALIGEYSGARNNPEVVAPLSKLKSLLGGGESTIQVVPIATYDGIAVGVRNANNRRGRTS